MGKANTLTGLSDTSWNTSTSEPITTGNTSTSEVSKSKKIQILYRYSTNIVQLPFTYDIHNNECKYAISKYRIPKCRFILTYNCGS